MVCSTIPKKHLNLNYDGFKMRLHITNGKFFNKIRKQLKVDKPYALGFDEWDEWYADLKAKQPVAYFITESFPDFIETVYAKSFGKLHEFRYWVRIRFMDKYHVVKTTLNPNQYHGADEIMLHANFQILVDFVEIELAHMQVSFSNKDNKYKKIRTIFGSRRNPEAGLDHLKWESNLDAAELEPHERSDAQARIAREKLALYLWWTKARPARKDVHEESGWSAICDEVDKKYGGGFSRKWEAKDPELKKRYDEALDTCHELENSRRQEDEDMLIRLIKIRENLWT